MESQWKIVSHLSFFKKQESKNNEGEESLWYWRLEYDGIYVAESAFGFDTIEKAKENAKHAKYIFSITDEKEFS